jgi:hypothetical protein
MQFSKGDKVRVWGEEDDIATVKGISKLPRVEDWVWG